jgi:SAM-dependent methyltransferase
MDTPAAEDYLKPYREAVKRHGAGFESTLWSSPEGQQIRFDVMIDLAGFADCTILDIGCGRGDFAQRLLDRSVPFQRFLGVDALPEVIEAARARELPRCEFRMADAVCDPTVLRILDADFICFSGSLNTMSETCAKHLVKAAFEAAAQGVVFNFLSDRPHERWADQPLSPARRFATVSWIDWALELTSRVTFTQDYLDGHDATIMLRHD